MKTKLVFLLTMLLFLSNCMSASPVVSTVSDIQGYSKDEVAIDARPLPEDDYYALERFENLQWLILGEHPEYQAVLTDRGLEIISNLDLPSLRTLHLGPNKNITNDGLKHLSRMQSVKLLSLTRCPNITGDGLRNLATMSTLDVLDLRGCTGITDRGLLYLTGMKNLKEIWLGGCSNVTKNGVENLQAALPSTHVEKDEEEWSMHAW